MKSTSKAVLVFAGLAVFIGALIWMILASRTEVSEKKESRLHAVDRAFMEEATLHGQLQIELADLAVRRSRNLAVNAYADRMRERFTEVNRGLEQLAVMIPIELPTAMDSVQREKVDRLANRQGAEFDYTYMQLMIHSHEQSITNFEEEIEYGHHENIRSFAENHLPVWKEQLERAETIRKELNRVQAN